MGPKACELKAAESLEVDQRMRNRQVVGLVRALLLSQIVSIEAHLLVLMVLSTTSDNRIPMNKRRIKLGVLGAHELLQQMDLPRQAFMCAKVCVKVQTPLEISLEMLETFRCQKRISYLQELTQRKTTMKRQTFSN